MPLRSGESGKATDNVLVLLQQSPEPNLIIRNGRFVECNRAALQLLGLRAKEQLIGIHPSDCSPLYQAGGRLSSEKANEILSSSLRTGSCRFEWRHIRTDATIAPVQVTLTRLNLDGEVLTLYAGR